MRAPVSGPATENSPPLGLPLRFFVAGPLALLTLYVALALGGDRLLTYYLLPANLAATHLATLGWVTMVMMGALYQFAPVVFRTRLYSERLGRWQFWLYVAGVAGLVLSFWQMWTAGLAICGSVVVLAVLLFLYNIGRTLLRSTHRSLTGQYLLHAFGCLALTVAVGLTFAVNLHFHWFAVPQHAPAAHVHLGVAGWFGLTVMGVTYELMPMFALVHGHGLRLARAVLWIVSGGVAALFVALLFGLPHVLVVAAALTLATGEALWIYDVLRMFRLRRRRAFDLTQQHTVASTAAFALTIAVGLYLLLAGPSSPAAETRWYVAYAVLALGGWLTPAIMGQMYKIVPFLVWHHRYSAKMGREPVPLLRDMYSQRRARIAFWLYLAGLAGAVFAVLDGSGAGLRLASLLAFMGCAGWAWLLVDVLRPHRVVVRTPAIVLPEALARH
jgi:cbb3-type cytochrome oxidase subunit 1